MDAEIIELHETATYKDGGSRDLKDSKGNLYWQDNRIESITKGTIYKGTVINKTFERAKGKFKIYLSAYRNQSRIRYRNELTKVIEQL